jgi:hypothetical protein
LASYEPAIDRIRYLVYGGKPQHTPKTINRIGNSILSYNLPIAFINDIGRWVVQESRIGRYSRTTDRHIRAAAMALAHTRVPE